MTSESLRRVGVPLAVALAVLALVLGVGRLVDPPGEGGSGSVIGAPGQDPTAGPTAGPTTDPTTDPDAPMSRFTSVTVGAGGATVDVHFWGGVEDCYRYTVLTRETNETVTLRLQEKSTFDGACIDLAQEYERTVALDEPLGARTVMDGVTGESLLAPSP